MTQEQRVFITADDILELEFSCSNDKCGLKMSFSIKKGIPLPAGCPACNTPWFQPYKDDERKTALYAFIDSLRQLRDVKSLPFTLRMRVSSHEAV
jgi:hypothetical protein